MFKNKLVIIAMAGMLAMCVGMTACSGSNNNASNSSSDASESQAAQESSSTSAASSAVQSQDIALDEYDADDPYPEVSCDYGDSKLYTREELEDAAIQVKRDIAAWEGCELHSLRYAGDECNTPENVQWLNEVNEGAGYTQVVEFLGDFHSPVTEEKPSAWVLDTEYTDYQWWLARTDDSSWQIVTSGY